MKQLIPIIFEMLDREPSALNVSMAEEATKRLGWTVDRKDISFIRNRIGLGHYQQIDAELRARLHQALTKSPSANWWDEIISHG